MNHTPNPPAVGLNPRTRPMNEAEMWKTIERAEAALRNMTWKHMDPARIPEGVTKVFEGMERVFGRGDDNGPSGPGGTIDAVADVTKAPEWVSTVLVFRRPEAPAGEPREGASEGEINEYYGCEGTCTCVNEGLLVRLTPGLAVLGVSLAEAYVAKAAKAAAAAAAATSDGA